MGQAWEGEGSTQGPHLLQSQNRMAFNFQSRDLGEGAGEGLPSRVLLLRANLKNKSVSVASVVCFEACLTQIKYHPYLPDIPPLILIPLGLPTFQEVLIKMGIVV